MRDDQRIARPVADAEAAIAVGRVDAREAHPHPHLARPGPRLGELADLQHRAGGAVSGVEGRLHAGTSLAARAGRRVRFDLAPAQAGDLVRGSGRRELRHHLGARRRGVGAARTEGAARREIARARRLAFDDAAADLAIALEARRGGEKRARVGMLRCGEDRAGGRELDDAAEIHDGDAVAHARDDGKVVRDEEVGQAEA